MLSSWIEGLLEFLPLLFALATGAFIMMAGFLFGRTDKDKERANDKSSDFS